MRGAKRSNDSEETVTLKKMLNQSPKVKIDLYESSPASGSHRSTRSQAYPDWTKLDSIILVNEIAAIEKECMKQLSSYQKWKLVADNCTALEVARNSHQCHRQWDSLLAEYNMIKQYHAKSTGDSFWSMGTERRIQLGVPIDFDNELFDVISELLRAQEERLNTDSGTDTETEMVDVVAESDCKKYEESISTDVLRGVKVSNLTSTSIDDEDKQKQEEAEEKGGEEEEGEEENEEEVEEDDQEEGEEGEQKGGEEERKNLDEEGKTRMEGKEGTLAAKLREKAELIHAILKGKRSEDMDCKLSELRNSEASRLEFTRRQCDKLIVCFGDLAKTLNQFSDLVQ